MTRVFADTDIILDLLGKREPFYPFSAALFSLADMGKIEICVSSLSFANLNYLLSRQYSPTKSRNLLLKFKTLVRVLPVTDKTVELALASDFKDFEDALQYYTATENKTSVVITRNIRDFKHAEISVMTAEQYAKGK